MPLKVLVACEYSGIVRDAFIAKGHHAVSCDLLPTERPGPHYVGDVRDILHRGFDLMIAHPPCTYLTVSANKWHLPEFKEKYPDREERRNEAADFFMMLYNSPIPCICIENPKGIMSSRFRPADQYVQPWMFGHATTKMTGLWLRNLPPLRSTDIVCPEWITAPSGNKYSPFQYNTLLLPEAERRHVRSKTFQGIADAMAEQWGNTELLTSRTHPIQQTLFA